MKFPSLFGRTPSHRRFEYRPRFYDARKEEREERERRIREELALEKAESSNTQGDYRDRIRGSFQRSRRRAKPSSETSAILLRLAVLLFISIWLIAYLQWGNKAFYALFLAIPAWFYFRFIRKG
jgi:hypothetical protein